MGQLLKKEDVKVADLVPYERNAKQHSDEQVEKIAKSIQEFGFLNPCLIDKDKNIIAGHGRAMAAKKLGLDVVPCVYVEGLTEAQRRAYILADNKLTELGDWDTELVFEELKELNQMGFNTDLTGFDLVEKEDESQIEEDGYNEEPPEEPKSKLGDVYQLGRHRLMCGDSTSKEDMDKLTNGKQPVFVFTDPPYGVAIGDKNKALNDVQKSGRCTENIKGDTLSYDELYKVLVAAMGNLREHCDDGCSYYVSAPQGGELGLMMMMMMMRDAGLQVRHNLVWVKNCATFSLGRLDYDYQHEPIFYTWTKSHTFYGGYNTTIYNDDKPIDKMSKAELKDLVRALQGDKETSVVYCDKPLKCDVHPTMKPVKLVGHFMINSSQKGDIVADIFGGSGTTLIAAEQLGRMCFMMELDPHYVDVIIDRWEKLTGEKAVLLSGGDSE